ncbi:hypothetical protein [uncultured Cohaesibacter sp.]|uniref:hypothetical protein n=1 Tax=uncultured Cohaesibacter sp. TaxID=1002546 RepID=UPI0029311972|nr:hypothetical protein [uncultured Cohaesibacter sp.]
MKQLYLKLFGALMLSAVTGTASAAYLPDCDSASVLSRVNNTLAIAETNVVQSGDPVIAIEHISQSKLLEQSEPFFAKRYCKATGYTETGKKTAIYYLIEANAGFVGYEYGVEACILGRDPWRIHGAYCRSVR